MKYQHLHYINGLKIIKQLRINMIENVKLKKEIAILKSALRTTHIK